MKLALITDTHWGVRNDNVAFLDNNKKFLDEIFFPYLKNNSIDTVVHLGDLVDRRKYININTARRLREDFLQPLTDQAIDVYMIAGNHDTYFKNTNEINALREIADSYKYIKIFDKSPETVTFDNLPILLMPWICDENRKQTLESLNSSKAPIVMGHLELAGFEMYRGSIVSHGDDVKLFDRFDMVMSGHYHHRSSNGHVFYLGNHGEFTWSDYDDPKGFHIFDTETRQLTFIRNPFIMFKKAWYNDQDKMLSEVHDVDFNSYKNCIVKVIVTNKTNHYTFDSYIEKLEAVNPLEIQIVEDHLNLALEEDDNIVNEAESTVDIFKKYINQIEAEEKIKHKIERTIVDLYQEALTIE